MAEDLTEFMHEAGLRVRYMHSDVETLERIELIRDLRLGVYDVLVGIKLIARKALISPSAASSRSWTPTRRGSCGRRRA